MELKRSLNSKIPLYCLGSMFLSFLLGYILLISLDKVESVTLYMFYFSTYTVITQFGTMIFPIIIINFFNIDYREKNILFFKSYSISAIKIFVEKIMVLLLWLCVSVIVCLIGFCLVYQSFHHFFVVLIYYINALTYIVLISSLLAFFTKNILMAYSMNLLIWVSSIVIRTILPHGNIIAYYDSSNELYNNFEKFLGTSNYSYLSTEFSIFYNIILFGVILLIVRLSSKRWILNGI